MLGVTDSEEILAAYLVECRLVESFIFANVTNIE